MLSNSIFRVDHFERKRNNVDTAHKARVVSRTLFGFTTDPEKSIWENRN